MAATLNVNTIFHPSHVNLGLYESKDRPSLHSIIEYLKDISKTDKNIYNGGHHIQHSGGSVCPRFDVHETVDAFFLEGEFPGIGDRDHISIERLGERGLLIEANSSKLDIENEWSMVKESQDVTNNTAVRPLLAEQNDNTKAQLSSVGPQPSQKTEVWSGPPKTDLSSTRLWPENQISDKGKGQIKGLLSERQTGYLQRSFTFPVPVDSNGLRARLKDGLLKVRVPKATVLDKRETFHIELDD